MMTRDKWISVLKGAAIAGAGAIGAYLMDAASTAGLGPFGPAVAAVISIGVNALRKYLEPPTPVTP
jgi:hypothetical protein